MRHRLLFAKTNGYQVDLNSSGGPFSAVTYDTLGIAGTTIGTSGSLNIPSGAAQIVVEIWGGGGGGAGGYYDTNDYGGGGGGSGGYTKITRALVSGDAGKSISWSRGAKGVAGTNETAPNSSVVCPGTNGGQSTSAGSTLTNSFSITAGGGQGGQIDTTAPFASGGSAGTTSGGDAGSSAGTAGTTGSIDTIGLGGAAIVGISSRSAGGGGDGGLYLGSGGPEIPTDGVDGRVIIYLT
jgi:hypothetical protein